MFMKPKIVCNIISFDEAHAVWKSFPRSSLFHYNYERKHLHSLISMLHFQWVIITLKKRRLFICPQLMYIIKSGSISIMIHLCKENSIVGGREFFRLSFNQRRLVDLTFVIEHKRASLSLCYHCLRNNSKISSYISVNVEENFLMIVLLLCARHIVCDLLSISCSSLHAVIIIRNNSLVFLYSR